ncbi:hypothetical protein [Streptomyces sp. NPDC014006]|uniref:hypothetical protein n=1 Tax=Streptomyces sp. NPDC014006 TaxID=3364870 RepID=UPI0036FED416
MQAVDDGTDLVLLAKDGVMEGEGQVKDGFGRSDVGVVGLSAQVAGGFEAAQRGLLRTATCGTDHTRVSRRTLVSVRL